MKKFLYIFISSLFTSGSFAEELSFNNDPDVYRGAYYGHLIAGRISIEGIKLSPRDSVVNTVSYVHALKSENWYRSAKIGSILTCFIRSTENPGFSVIEIDTYLSIDGLQVIKILPSLVENSDKRLPDKQCIPSNSHQNLPQTSS